MARQLSYFWFVLHVVTYKLKSVTSIIILKANDIWNDNNSDYYNKHLMTYWYIIIKIKQHMLILLCHM